MRQEPVIKSDDMACVLEGDTDEPSIVDLLVAYGSPIKVWLIRCG